mgnify:CR=1 FL=1
MLRLAVILAAALAVNWIAGEDAAAELLPSRPITIVIPFTPGASADTIQRIVANDSLAKDDLRSRAEIFRLSYHQFPNNATNKAQGGGLLDSFRAELEDLGQGLGVTDPVSGSVVLEMTA